MTGISAPTWRYWAQNGDGPTSFKIGRRRVWRRTVAEEWLREQERAGA
ncbi:DNA-binding protein [Mycobacterium sp. 94-17]|nr:DNA-binding protein [Mycobacterium sp. 94-17]